MTISHTYSIICDRSDEDGITCYSIGAETIQDVERMARDNRWISGDGYHECPRHRAGEARSTP